MRNKKIQELNELEHYLINNAEIDLFTYQLVIKLTQSLREDILNMHIVNRSNKENKEPIIGKITSTAFTVENNHGILKIELPYGYHKMEKWKKGDKVELIITD